MMKIMIWNCRGANSNHFCSLVLNYKRIHNFNVLAVVETRVSGLIADRVIGKLKLENSVRVEAVGRSGGIWLLWNGSKDDLKVLKTARHLIH